MDVSLFDLTLTTIPEKIMIESVSPDNKTPVRFYNYFRPTIGGKSETVYCVEFFKTGKYPRWEYVFSCLDCARSMLEFEKISTYRFDEDNSNQ